MAILKVSKLGAPVLRGRASEVETIDLKRGRLKPFFEDLMETMVEYDGTGLAAPQVNMPLRVVLYMVEAERKGRKTANLAVAPRILVNPEFEILDKTEIEDVEACLSVPFLAASVPRPKKIRVRALDPTGKPVIYEAEDFHARVVLHESDHLDGVVYLDRVKDRTSIHYTIDF
ncbi:MAG: peptide deformylase [Acidobacteria bacterium]|nr:peptide deformylase [Acidobacteriota bacterium]